MTGTFKPRKMDLVAEGYDPSRGRDPVFFDDRAAGAYVKVDEALTDAIASGTLRL
jgi:fatty-acyl-CoA synthase